MRKRLTRRSKIADKKSVFSGQEPLKGKSRATEAALFDAGKVRKAMYWEIVGVVRRVWP